MIFLHPTITELRWSGPATLDVRFASNETARLHQLYVGRRLHAVSTSASQRRLTASLIPSRWPEWITVVAADATDSGTDRGSWLPRRAYNRVLVRFNQTGWAGSSFELDVLKFELFRGSVPEGAIDYSNVIDSELAKAGNPGYELETDPLPGSGEWNVGVRGIDETVESGNTGTAAETTATVLATPPDFEERFGVSVSGGLATFTATIPVD